MLADTGESGGVPPDELERFATQLLMQSGAPEAIASEVAESLVLSDVRGHNSHGTRRIPTYLSYALEKRENAYAIDASARSTVDVEGPTHAVIDGQNAYGQVIGREAVDLSVEKADENGVAMVGIRDATHLGRIGEWSERAAEAGMLFAAYVYNHGRTVAPPGSAQQRYSTNPISYGVPTFDALEFPIMLDIATSQVAHGKTGEFASQGDPLPESWTVDDDGGVVTDSAAFRSGQGALLPLGGMGSGYKGFGLAMIAELFGGIAGDTPVHGETSFDRGCAAMFVTADPTLFTTRETVEARVTALREYIADTEFSPDIPTSPVAYGDEALLPGEPEHLTEQDRRANGIPLPERDVEDLCALAVEYGIEDAIPSAFENGD